jgi:hypothetical protein
LRQLFTGEVVESNADDNFQPAGHGSLVDPRRAVVATDLLTPAGSQINSHREGCGFQHFNLADHYRLQA